MSKHTKIANPNVEDILNVEKETYDIIKGRW